MGHIWKCPALLLPLFQWLEINDMALPGCRLGWKISMCPEGKETDL